MGDRDRSRDRSRRDRNPRFSETSRDRSLDRKDRGGGGGQKGNRVYVSNIPYEYRWQDLKDLFRNQVGEVSFVELFIDETEKPRGCGIVEFSDPDSVQKCLDVMHRFELKNRKLVIKEDHGNDRDKYGNVIGTAASRRARERERESNRDERRGGRGGGVSFEDTGKWGNTYGLSPQFLESLNINSPLINRVFVANLDYKVDKKKLKEIFRLAGRVQRVDLSLDKDGKSRGFAVVEYDHPVEAVQSISMFHNQMLYDRQMTVRMDREGDRAGLKLPDGLKGIGMGLGSNGEPLKEVARNLPSITNNPPQPQAVGSGILGAVPNAGLGALNLNSALGTSALNSLSNNAAALQAAALGGLSTNLLASSLGGGDLGLANLVQNQSLAALASSNATGNTAAFARNDNPGPFGNQTANSGFGNTNRNFEDSKPNRPFNYNDRNEGIFNNASNGQMHRGAKANFGNTKILISNLPPSATYKLLTDKCNEFGNVQNLEDKGSGSVLVTYSTEWEAERAIKNMDRARIDGHSIDVHFF